MSLMGGTFHHFSVIFLVMFFNLHIVYFNCFRFLKWYFITYNCVLYKRSTFTQYHVSFKNLNYVSKPKDLINNIHENQKNN